MLVNIVRKLDKRRFHSVVGYIYGAGTLAAEIKRAGVKVVDLSRKGKIDPWLMIKLFLLIRKEKIKIVHTHLVHASIVGRIAAKLAGIKTVLTTRHYAYERKEQTLIYWLERKTACLNEVTIAISNAVRNYLLNNEEYKPQKVVVIHNAIDLDLFDSCSGEPMLRTGENFLIGTVGRLHPQKGYDTLLKSMPQVIEKFPHVKLMIIGNGFQKEYLERFCSNLGISEQVTFLGRKTPAEVIGFLRNIDLFVLASNWEGFGIVVLEAMAEAKPVIATNVEGLPEVVEDGQTGFLVSPVQPIELANRIIELLNDRGLSKRMGIKGRERVEAMFSLNSMISKLEGLYQKLEKGEQ